MGRTKFFFLCSTLFGLLLLCSGTKDSKGYLYQLKIYHIENKNQESRINSFLKNAYIPALHRMGIPHVGIFKPVDSAQQLLYLFIPYSSFDQFRGLDDRLLNDRMFLKNGKDYLEAEYDDPPYQRIESILITAFKGVPQPYFPTHKGNKKEWVYELRSYEGPTERYYKQKVKMFHVGDEISLFKRLQFNAVFYGEVLAGSHMPNLMYMTSFESMEERNRHWDLFNNDPQWKALKAQEEYLHSVSKADIFLLHPTDYSDF